MFKFRLTKKRLAIITLVISVGIGTLAFLFRSKVEYLEDLGYFGIFLANLLGSATIFLPIPAFAATAVGGAFLNPLFTGIVSASGSAIGELTGYFAGAGGEEFVKDNKNIQKVERWMSKYGLWTLFVLAAIPNPFFDLAGIIAGATGISVKKYLLIVWLGKLVKFIIIAYLGAGSIKVLGSFT